MARVSVEPQRVVFRFEYDLEVGDSGQLAPPDVVAAVIADAVPNTSDLRAELRHAAGHLSEQGPLVEIEDVQIREGSIVFFVTALVGIAKALDLYGGAREGLNQILRDLASICERFLWRFGGGGRMRPRLRVTSWSAASPTPIGHRGTGRLPFDQYLMASNCLLILTLIGVLVVLLIRTA